MDLLQSASGLQRLNERLGTDNREKPQKTLDPTVSFRQSFCTSLLLACSK